MTTRPDWFPVLEPPAGGALRLRRALARERRDARGRGAIARVALAAAAVLVLAVVPLVAQRALRPDPVEHALAAVAASPAAVRVAGGAALEVSTSRADVEVWLVVTGAGKPD